MIEVEDWTLAGLEALRRSRLACVFLVRMTERGRRLVGSRIVHTLR